MLKQCSRKDCKQANRCVVEDRKNCESYPSAPTYPSATPRSKRTNLFP